MAIDWDRFRDELEPAIENAGSRTDSQLAGKISAITKMSDEEVKALFPDPADVKKLADLMAIVKSAGDQNDKLNKLVSNAENFGGIILTLLSKFV